MAAGSVAGEEEDCALQHDSMFNSISLRDSSQSNDSHVRSVAHLSMYSTLARYKCSIMHTWVVVEVAGSSVAAVAGSAVVEAAGSAEAAVVGSVVESEEDCIMQERACRQHHICGHHRLLRE